MAVALVKHGADFSIKNAQDELPLDLAPDKEVRISFDDSDSDSGPGPGLGPDSCLGDALSYRPNLGTSDHLRRNVWNDLRSLEHCCNGLH